MVLVDFELRYQSAGAWAGAFVFDREYPNGRQTLFTELEGLTIPCQNPWHITLRAIEYTLMDALGQRGQGDMVKLFGLSGKRYGFLLAQEVQGGARSAFWTGGQPVNYGFGVLASLEATNIALIRGNYEVREGDR